MAHLVNQAIFRTVYVTLAAIGCIRTLGIFKGGWNPNFYVFYTHLSNYLCLAFMIVVLAKNVRELKAGVQVPAGGAAARLEFYCVIMILVTCLVANTLLDCIWKVDYWRSLNFDNFVMHLAAPLLFVLDWFIFAQHGTLRWYDPLLCMVPPLLYVVFILLRGKWMTSASTLIRYPYFFLDVDVIGYGGVLRWVLILLVAFAALGYLLFFVDARMAAATKG